MTVRGEPLGAQRPVKAQTQLPTGVGRVFRRGFLRRQTAMETPALSEAVAAPIPQGLGRDGAKLGEGRGFGR